MLNLARHLLLAAAANALLVASCGRPAGELPSIVVITIDTIRADHVGAYGYFRDTSPRLDALAAEGVLFRKAVTTMATTLPAHLSLWTSRYPIQTGVLANGNRFKQQLASGARVRLLAEMLQDQGYATGGFVSATPVKHYTGIAVGFDAWDEPQGSQRPAGETIDKALEWLGGEPDEPFFLWVHLFDPHTPLEPPPPYDSAFSSDERLVQVLWERRLPDPLDAGIQRAHDLYDGEILYTDSEIGRLLDRLRAMGRYADSTIVVVGDHGEGLGQHDRMTHGEIYNEQLFVPLIMRFPDASGLNGRTVDTIVSLTDVVPTLVARLGLPLSAEDRAQFTGYDALADRPERRFAFAQRVYGPKRNWGKGEKYALIGADWKYTYSTRAPDELFDMRQDFVETVNLIGVERDVARELKHELLGALDRYARTNDEFQVDQETSEEVQRELRALGYIQ